MKLNNKGWGTLEMFLLSGGLIIALIVAVFFISKLYGSLESAVGNKSYVDLEIKLENSAKKYISDKDIVINGEYKISYNTLKSYGYINSLEINNDKCDGYVMVKNVDNINYYNGYLSCESYETLNY